MTNSIRIMKKLLLLLFICSFCEINAQETKYIPLDNLTCERTAINLPQNTIIFKGSKWNSYVKLPSSCLKELPNYKYIVLNIPQSTVTVRFHFESINGEQKDFYQLAVKSGINRKLDLSLVPFINKVKEIRIEAAESIDTAGNYHTICIKSIQLVN